MGDGNGKGVVKKGVFDEDWSFMADYFKKRDGKRKRDRVFRAMESYW